VKRAENKPLPGTDAFAAFAVPEWADGFGMGV